MNHHELTLAALLDFAAASPALIGWHSVQLPSLEFVFLADSRAEGTMMILEAVAGQHGRIVNSAAKPDSPWIGCLIEPNEDDLEKAAGELRAAYLIATTGVSAEGETGPF
ncbi:MAG: hypothetical protein F9B45_22125 [Phycisphaera sp. RhM]|nr:hypothetical protein [Phycisphaera sp. RhM]